jgi:hypothetical protein
MATREREKERERERERERKRERIKIASTHHHSAGMQVATPREALKCAAASVKHFRRKKL